MKKTAQKTEKIARSVCCGKGGKFLRSEKKKSLLRRDHFEFSSTGTTRDVDKLEAVEIPFKNQNEDIKVPRMSNIG